MLLPDLSLAVPVSGLRLSGVLVLHKCPVVDICFEQPFMSYEYEVTFSILGQICSRHVYIMQSTTVTEEVIRIAMELVKILKVKMKI